MTPHFPAKLFSALIVTSIFSATGTVAQDAARIIQEEQPAAAVPETVNEGDQEGTSPDWPVGLEDWDSSPRNADANEGEAEERGLTSQGVTESGAAEPNEQGTRSTETLEEESDPGLYHLLAQVRAAPPGLDGTPIPRPNPLASEPSLEMAPAQPEDVYLFPDGYIE